METPPLIRTPCTVPATQRSVQKLPPEMRTPLIRTLYAAPRVSGISNEARQTDLAGTSHRWLLGS